MNRRCCLAHQTSIMHKENIPNLQAFLDKELARRESVRVLEAGCGSSSYMNFGEKVCLVGIDISEKQLQRNMVLQEKIVGDIQQYDLPPASFDIIVCWDVLEHLPRPELALRRFARAAKTNGLVIIKVPNVLSVKGLVTKFLPHALHVMAYRYIYSEKDAGKNDTAPFKTYLRFSIAANAIKKLCAEEGLQTAYFETYDVTAANWLQRKKLAFLAYVTLKRIFKLLSSGRISESEFVLVLKKMKPAD
jgi:2-polyprenyl-3-methyl-5-hydroxy-6-metoxy-1,4-benzoquinol methylase